MTSFICSFDGCSATFAKSKKLKIHLLTHSNERPFICLHDTCTATFKRAAHLKRHEETHEDKKICCTESGCNQTFSSPHTLQKHIKRKHERIGMFKCNHCDAQFMKHQHLKVHEFQHTGVRNYKCTFEGCEKAYVIPSHLKKHMKCHKGYTCDIDNCGEIFDKWSLFRQHKKLKHPPEYLCSICKKVFRKKINLKQHLSSHENNQPTFSCTYEGCCREYSLERSLKQHIRCSHQEPQFCCTFEGCDKRYKHKTNLKKHVREHSPSHQPPIKKKRDRKYNFYKHKSVASTLSNYKASSAEEREILRRDKEFVRDALQETMKQLEGENNGVLNNAIMPNPANGEIACNA